MDPSTPSHFLLETKHKIRTIESRLEKIAVHVTPSKLLEVQESCIKELQESLEHRKTSIPDEYKKWAAELGENACNVLIKIEEQKSQIIQGKGSSKKDPGMYKLIEKRQLSHGIQYVFEEIDPKIDLHDILFPAVVYPFFQVQNMLYRGFEGSWEVLKQLGYDLDLENRIITLPDSDLLNKNCKLIQKKYPALGSFEAVSSDNTASDPEFIGTSLDGKTTLSKDMEFTHDHLVHIIPELLNRLRGNYLPARKTVAIVLNPVRETIKKVQSQLEGHDEKDKIEVIVRQLLTICSMWLDSYSSDHIRSLRGFNDRDILDFSHSVTMSDRHCGAYSQWKSYFNDRYPESPLTKKRGQLLTILLATIQYPNVVKFFERKKQEAQMKKIRDFLEGIEVTENRDPCRLSFKSVLDNINIEDNPLEVIKMVTSSARLRD